MFLAIGVGMLLFSRRFRRRAARAQGRIVGFDTSRPSQRPGFTVYSTSPLYRPTVTFTTRDGRDVTATSSFGSNPRPGRVGDVVPVLYDPADPQHMRVDTLRAGGGCLQGAFIALGGVLAAFGIALVVAAR